MATGVYLPNGAYNGIIGLAGNGLYSPDGGYRFTEATTEWGAQAPDGSYYCEIVTADTGNGLQNGRGNYRIVTVLEDEGNGLYAANGAWRVGGVSSQANIAPVIDFNNGAIWTVAGTGSSSTDTTFSASGSAYGALAVVPPLTIGVVYYYEVAFTITAGATLQIINGTTTTPVIDSMTVGGTMSGTFEATNTNFRLRATAASTTTVTTLVLKALPWL